MGSSTCTLHRRFDRCRADLYSARTPLLRRRTFLCRTAGQHGGAARCRWRDVRRLYYRHFGNDKRHAGVPARALDQYALALDRVRRHNGRVISALINRYYRIPNVGCSSYLCATDFYCDEALSKRFSITPQLRFLKNASIYLPLPCAPQSRMYACSQTSSAKMTGNVTKCPRCCSPENPMWKIFASGSK